MRKCLLIEAELSFNPKLRRITWDWRGDAITEGSTLYYGVHFVSAPATINPGDRIVAELLLRAYPEESFQVGERIWLKEGPLTRAEGTIIHRSEHEIPNDSALGILGQLRKGLR